MELHVAAFVAVFILTLLKHNSNATAVNSRNNHVLRQPRITNGTSIPITTAPYMVSIHLKFIDLYTGFGAGVVCGGAVISQRVVITAASCVANYGSTITEIFPASDYTVFMGSMYTNKTDKNTLQYNVQEIVAYPTFNLTSPLYDVALLFINGYIPWNWPTVKAVQLNSKEMPVGTSCTVTGWQIALYSFDSMELLSVNVPIMNSTVCSASTNYGTIPQSVICAGFSNFSSVNACNGDSGNPLVCNGYLTGIVSKGSGCGADSNPGFYGNISDFYNWIVQTNASFDYKTYGSAMGIYVHSNVMVFLSLFVALVLYY